MSTVYYTIYLPEAFLPAGLWKAELVPRHQIKKYHKCQSKIHLGVPEFVSMYSWQSYWSEMFDQTVSRFRNLLIMTASWRLLRISRPFFSQKSLGLYKDLSAFCKDLSAIWQMTKISRPLSKNISRPSFKKLPERQKIFSFIFFVDHWIWWKPLKIQKCFFSNRLKCY